MKRHTLSSLIKKITWVEEDPKQLSNNKLRFWPPYSIHKGIQDRESYLILNGLAVASLEIATIVVSACALYQYFNN